MSHSDTGEWVISNSTPLPGTGYPAGAIVHFEVTVDSFRGTAAEIAKQDDVAVVDAKTGPVMLDSGSRKSWCRPLGRPCDMRFAGILSSGAVSGDGTIAEHRVAFRRLSQADHNANDWYVVAMARQPVGSLLGAAGWRRSAWLPPRSPSSCSPA